MGGGGGEGGGMIDAIAWDGGLGAWEAREAMATPPALKVYRAWLMKISSISW